MWAEAINTATYIKNRVPHKALVDKTPQECWSGEKTDISHLKVFGCVAYMHVPKKIDVNGILNPRGCVL
jgi:hypothetical protein